MTCERCKTPSNEAFDSEMLTTLLCQFPCRLCLRCQRDYTQQVVAGSVASANTLYSNLLKARARVAATVEKEDAATIAGEVVAAEKAITAFSVTFLATKPAWAVP